MPSHYFSFISTPLIQNNYTILNETAEIKIMTIIKPAYEPGNPLQIIIWMCQAAKKFSTISIPGVYGSAYDQFPLGLFFNRNIQIKMGQCPVKKYNDQLLHLIETRRIDHTKIISHTMKLD